MYTAPGSLAEEQIPNQERVKAAMDEARYHLGPLRYAPWLALKDVTYYDNVYGTTTDKVSDYTATLGAGLHGYVPLASRLTLGMYAMPEYVWWKDLSNRRGWNGGYGAGLFGYFNRATLEVKAGASRNLQYVSNEFEIPADLEDRSVSALFEVQVVGQLSLFVRGGVDKWRYSQRGLPTDVGSQLAGLDRDESHVGGGVRLHFSRDLSLGLGVEQYTTDFVQLNPGSSNSGPAPVAELSAKSGRWSLTVNAQLLDLKPTGSSNFVPYTGTNGNFRIGFQPAGRATLEYYGGRSLAYSVQPEIPYYIDERMGLGLQSALGWRSTGRVYWETGHDDYAPGSQEGSPRRDDFRTYGATFNVGLGRFASLVFTGDRTDYTSTVAAYDRAVSRFQVSLQLSSGKAQWW